MACGPFSQEITDAERPSTLRAGSSLAREPGPYEKRQQRKEQVNSAPPGFLTQFLSLLPSSASLDGGLQPARQINSFLSHWF